MQFRRKVFNGLLLLGILLAAKSVYAQEGEMKFTLSSPAFSQDSLIPIEYTCKGKDINPPLEVQNIPEGTKTLALIVDDPDAPMGTWVHWVVFNIRLQTRIPEDSIPGDQAKNDFQQLNYGGPCPPNGTHRYFFKLYALDTSFDKSKIRHKQDLERAMRGHILAEAQLIGLFAK
jgi:Raf kinase inhibitor-like YbhB/YbcL family protein